MILAAALRAIDALPRGEVSYRLPETALPDLPRYQVMYPVLKRIDLLDSRDFGLVERVCVGGETYVNFVSVCTYMDLLPVSG